MTQIIVCTLAHYIERFSYKKSKVYSWEGEWSPHDVSASHASLRLPEHVSQLIPIRGFLHLLDSLLFSKNLNCCLQMLLGYTAGTTAFNSINNTQSQAIDTASQFIARVVLAWLFSAHVTILVSISLEGIITPYCHFHTHLWPLHRVRWLTWKDSFVRLRSQTSPPRYHLYSSLS